MTSVQPGTNGRGEVPDRLGLVVGGSLTQGVEARLTDGRSVEDVRVGQFVTVQSPRHRFFGTITDLTLESSDQRLRASLPDGDTAFIAAALGGTVAFGTMKLLITLVLGGDAQSTADGPQPARTIPPHFSRVSAASEADIARVFGREDEKHFSIGNPLDMEVKVCLDLSEFVKRSNGVFGKSGTGKTFLTRLLLAGVLQKTDAVNLVFDMHSEYGWMGTLESDDGRHTQVKGLKQLFPGRVAVFTLDPDSARRRRIQPDHVVRIGYSDFEPEDVALLRETLNLSPVSAEAALALERHFGAEKWLGAFLDTSSRDLKELAEETGAHQGSLAALHNRLQRLRKYPFLQPGPGDDSVRALLDYLQRGVHVVLEFGKYVNDLTAYMLVANILTRRIHQRYVEQKEAAMGEQGQEPRPLVITIEEAHRFLNPEVASQTIFGTIARELRKYNVTLLLVDQRPSQIDTEVLSQVGTKLCCLLDDERDVDAVMQGVSGGRELRAVLSRLETKQQALVFGHSVPMPVMVRVRTYGPDFYREMGAERADPATAAERARKFEDEFFGRQS